MKVTCSACDQQVPVKKDGSLWKHLNPATDQNCDGQPAQEAEAPIEEDEAPQPEVQYYTKELLIKGKPKQFVHDDDWHARNHTLVIQAAEREGVRLTGRITFEGVRPEGRHTALIYRAKRH